MFKIHTTYPMRAHESALSHINFQISPNGNFAVNNDVDINDGTLTLTKVTPPPPAEEGYTYPVNYISTISGDSVNLVNSMFIIRSTFEGGIEANGALYAKQLISSVVNSPLVNSKYIYSNKLIPKAGRDLILTQRGDMSIREARYSTAYSFSKELNFDSTKHGFFASATCTTGKENIIINAISTPQFFNLSSTAPLGGGIPSFSGDVMSFGNKINVYFPQVSDFTFEQDNITEFIAKNILHTTQTKSTWKFYSVFEAPTPAPDSSNSSHPILLQLTYTSRQLYVYRQYYNELQVKQGKLAVEVQDGIVTHITGYVVFDYELENIKSTESGMRGFHKTAVEYAESNGATIGNDIYSSMNEFYDLDLITKKCKKFSHVCLYVNDKCCNTDAEIEFCPCCFSSCIIDCETCIVDDTMTKMNSRFTYPPTYYKLPPNSYFSPFAPGRAECLWSKVTVGGDTERWRNVVTTPAAYNSYGQPMLAGYYRNVPIEARLHKTINNISVYDPILDDDGIWEASEFPNNETYYFDMMYCLQESISYFKDVHNLSSFDNNNGPVGIVAFRDIPAWAQGLFGQAQLITHPTYGITGIIHIPIHTGATLDVIGHEFTHLVTMDDLQYSDEQGILAESISDIFGQLIDTWSNTQHRQAPYNQDIDDTSDLYSGEVSVKGFGILRFDNPSQAISLATGAPYPIAYLGKGWLSGYGRKTDDHGNIHYRTSVLNYWFYICTHGTVGAQVNEFGVSYNINPIVINPADSTECVAIPFSVFEQIMFVALSYITRTSGFGDFRAAILSACAVLGLHTSSITNMQFLNTIHEAFKAINLNDQKTMSEFELTSYTAVIIPNTFSGSQIAYWLGYYAVIDNGIRRSFSELPDYGSIYPVDTGGSNYVLVIEGTQSSVITKMNQYHNMNSLNATQLLQTLLIPASINMTLPTLSVGLLPGDLWNDAGTLKIV